MDLTEFLIKICCYRRYRDVRKAAWKVTQSSTLVWIAMTHIMLTIPANIMYIYLMSEPTQPSDGLAIGVSFTYVLYVIGHAANQVVYFFTNEKFKEETSYIISSCKNVYWTKAE